MTALTDKEAAKDVSWEVVDESMLRSPLTFGTQLLESHLRNSAFVVNIKREFAEMVENDIIQSSLRKPRIIKGTDPPERVYAIPDAKQSILVPKYKNEEMTPGTAIKTGSDYMMRIQGKWAREKLVAGKWETIIPYPGPEYNPVGASRVLLELFIMLGCKWCWTYGKQDTPEGRRLLLADGLREDDPFCWFIVGGRRRVFKHQEKLLLDRILISYFTKSKQLACQAVVKVSTGTHRIRVCYNPEASRKALCREIGVNLTGMFNHTLNIYRMYRLLMWPGAETNLSDKDMQTKLDQYNAKTTEMWIREFDQLIISMLYRPALAKASMSKLTTTKFIFKSLGALSDEEYMGFLLSQRSTSTLASAKKIADDKKNFSKENVFKTRNEKFCKNLDEALLERPGTIMSYQAVRQIKTIFLAQMVAKFIETESTALLPDDRDRWVNKHIDLPGKSVAHQVAVAFDTKISSLDVNLGKTMTNVTNDVNKMIHSGFKTNNWGVKGAYNITTGVVFDLLHDSIPLVWSEVTQIRPPLNTKKTQVNSKIRSVQEDQEGFLDPLYTPEDDLAGLVKSGCITMETTFQQDFYTVYVYVRTLMAELKGRESKSTELSRRLYVPKGQQLSKTGVRIFVDQYFAGNFNDIDLLYNTLRDARNRGEIKVKQPHYLNFCWKFRDNNFHILTNGGRLTRPLLIVDRVLRPYIIPTGGGESKETPVIDVSVKLLDAARDDPDVLKLPTMELVRRGFVEFIDCNEQSTICYIADTISRVDLLRASRDDATRHLLLYKNKVSSLELDKLQELKRRADRDLLDLTNCEIDGQNILGISSGANPLVNFAPAPRGTFQGKISLHALNCYPDQMTLFEPMNKVLFWPVQPIFQTFINNYMRLDKYPAGQVCWVAIAAMDVNQEDGLAGKKEAFAAGLFSYLKISTIPVEISASQSTRRPHTEEDISHLDAEGIVKPGEWLEENQILVNLVNTYETPSKTSVTQDVPIRMPAYSKGYILAINRAGIDKRLLQIQVVELRKYGQAAKIAARYSQKGMICGEIAQKDLPEFEVDGQKMTPSLVFNPHALPSRMTVGLLIEGILTMAGILQGVRVDASAFSLRDMDINKALDVLKANGYPEDMKFTARNPKTGVDYENKMFFAPFYYQALPHHYADEVQYRGPGGSRKMDTHQPTGHRQTLNASAQRFGEQERDAAASFGATNFLTDRTCIASDAEPFIICKQCGSKIDERLIVEGARGLKAELVCTGPECKSAEVVVAPDVPGVLNMWSQLLQGLMISTHFHTSAKPTGFIPDTTDEKGY